MTDEEKKAVNQLKADTNFYDYELKNGKYIYELFKIEVYKKDVDVILNLIEKQSKEIEELKDIAETLRKENVSLYIERRQNENKIKAKIEEIDYKMIAHQDVREAVKAVLQSLLDKE